MQFKKMMGEGEESEMKANLTKNKAKFQNWKHG